MAYNDTLVVEHIKKTHETDRLSVREKHLVGLAVTMTRGCQICTRNRIERAYAAGIPDADLNALIAIVASVNSGVSAATARIAFGLLQGDSAAPATACGEVCSPTPD